MSPMENSPKAVCWGGINYADSGNEGEAEQLACKFKNEEIANRFKNLVEECQAKVATTEENYLYPEND